MNVFTDYGLTRDEASPVVEALTKKPKEWVDFMMRFELGLEEPDPKRALQSAATIAGSYIAGGFIPLSPYMIFHSSRQALLWSAAGNPRSRWAFSATSRVASPAPGPAVLPCKPL